MSESNIDEALKAQLGMLSALEVAIRALFRTHPHKEALTKVLQEEQAIMLAKLHNFAPAPETQTLFETYHHVLQGLAQDLPPIPDV